MLTDLGLPAPDPDALGVSRALVAQIDARIAAHGGWIDFADYMQLALYAPGLGYYSAGAAKFGETGDFVTAPEISSLFSACLARSLAGLLEASGGGEIVELGAGSGRMAADLLASLAQCGALPDRYRILEVSAELRQRQARTLASVAPGLADRVTWLDELPGEPIAGVIVANEVADALPVARFRIGATGAEALGVASRNGAFDWSARPAPESLAARVLALRPPGERFVAGYTSELCPALPAWLGSLADSLACGTILVVDYGLPRRAYYAPDRSTGTLRCHYRHRVHDDPFLYPGLQDITAWVDFTSLAEAADAAGLTVAAFTTQAQFLIGTGLEVELERIDVLDSRARMELARQVRQLTMPGEMGELVKVMALTRDIELPVAGLGGRDLRHLL